MSFLGFFVRGDLVDYTDKVFLDFCTQHDLGSNILELGCGRGHFAEELAKRCSGSCYSAVDLHDYREKACQLPFYTLDISRDRLPFDDNSIHTIIVSQVLEHVHDFCHLFKESHRVLALGGKIHLKIPNFNNIYGRINYLLRGRNIRLEGTIDNGGHINLITDNFLKSFLRDYFVIKDCKGDLFLELYSSSVLSKLCKKPMHVKNLNIRSCLFSWNKMIELEKKTYD